MIKQIKIFGLIIFLIIGCNSSQKEDGTVIVSVGEGRLTLERLNNVIPSSIQSKISQEQINNYIQQWIETELIYREALRLGMDEDEELQLALENAKREFLVRKYLDKYLSDYEGLTDTAAFEYYKENQDNYILADDEIRAFHILVSTNKEANNVYKRLREGEDFEAIARDVSKEYFENKRIDLGYFKKEDILPEIAAKVFNYRVGLITKPLQSEFGYHFFKIVDRKQKGSYREFDEVKDQIIARLQSMKRNEKYRDLIIDLRNKIDYKMNIEPLKEFYKDSTYQNSSQIVEKLN